jgi:hypothetical protein
MTAEHANIYDVDTCNSLKEKFLQQKLHRPMRVTRCDAGTRLSFDITGIIPPHQAQIHLEIEKFVGSGFAGQVYKVKVLDIETKDGPINGIEKNGVYAVKIMIPPSGFSRFFRGLVYRIGFQGPFQLQVNPTAARAGALWQKFIRRGAKIRFGDESTVNDIHATFVDTTLGSCGEISDWVEGRTWRLEVDEWMDLLKKFKRKKLKNHENLGSPEYRIKKQFMADFVKLLHDMGAHEFARQYEWSTCKSQPNCLKRKETENGPAGGLVAIDFRAGLALLPFLPMSPGDIMLIFKGIARGSLVQFDRGSLKKLEKFIKTHEEEFKDMLPWLEELKTCEREYRNSVPDITHNHVRLLFSKKLWSTILKSLRTSWRTRNKIDEKNEQKLNKSTILTLIFSFLGMIPFLGSLIRKLWARPDWRKHYAGMLTRWDYLKRAIRGKCAEKAIAWNRAERVNGSKAQRIAGSFARYLLHLTLSVLPAGLHRFLTDGKYFKDRLFFLFVRPIKLYFSAALREQWLRDMLMQGQKKQMLAEEDARKINSQLNEPFIQKYLKSLTVHLCTIVATEIGSIIIAGIYALTHPGTSFGEAAAISLGLMVFFQFTPISPGSLVRGIYVVYLVIKERNIKDYNLALFLSFFKYIGYLAFPIQMTYKYPELARFMAGHWATEGVHIVPVFGESGALLEHWVFGLFYNWPLTIRRRMRSRAQFRASLPPRYWHVFLYAAGAAAILIAAGSLFLGYTGIAPGLKDTWWLVLLIAVLCGAGVTVGCGGAAISRRLVSAAVWGILTGLLYTAASVIVMQEGNIIPGELAITAAWRVFIFTIFATIAAVVTELRLPDPNIKA